MIDEYAYVQEIRASYDNIFSQNNLIQRNDHCRDKVKLWLRIPWRRWAEGQFHDFDFDFCNDHHVDDEDGNEIWWTLEVWKFVGGDQSPVDEINLTHKLPRGFTPNLWARGVNLSTREGRGRGTRNGLDVAHIKISLHLRRTKRGWAENRGEEQREDHGGAYLRVIPEGRTPSAWDLADNVSPLRAIPPTYTGCRSCRIDCTLRRDALGKNVKVGWIESGMLKGVQP